MFFRPDDSTPLDEEEERAWLGMEQMGRRRYIWRRTILTLDWMIIPVVVMVWGIWWLRPASRPYILDPFLLIPLVIGAAIVGPLAAAHAWDTWRSYERRSQIDDDGNVLPQAEAHMVRSQTKERVE